ncbi:hypothetical protein EDD17DRAFT_36926 [Pisolithus thermaeus]|nr:hypothetical protein EDD17DRAFT_36926 [Pisolithus thermaeus]
MMSNEGSGASASRPLLGLYHRTDIPSGSLFPFNGPSDADIARLLQSDFVASHPGDVVEIRDVTTSKLFTTAPSHYFELIRRFLWRRAIYRKILEGDILNSFEDDVANSVRCNAVYLDSVLRWIQRRLKAAANSDPPGRVRLLDTFMLEEYYVGRHEPSALICWQRKNPATNMRIGDILSNTFNWQEPRQRFGDAWDGLTYRWNIQALDSEGLEDVVNACKALFEDFYDHPYPRMVTLPGDTEESRYYGGDVISIA